ncbi:hypothetical protein F5B18DRAFT_409755 [Nemania serpens]|nr:hypothetical protein F5B18DRAFT_409755 [Nemania serpens]
MAIQFCEDCGDTLPISVRREVPCDCCDLILNKTTVTTSSAFPSKLRSQLSLIGSKQVISKLGKLGWPVINQPCEKCTAKETSYTTLQLRGADEGTTVIYYCRQCGHHYSDLAGRSCCFTAHSTPADSPRFNVAVAVPPSTPKQQTPPRLPQQRNFAAGQQSLE